MRDSQTPRKAARRQGDTQSVSARLLPACLFLFALCVLVTVVYGDGYGALPPVEQRYTKAKADMERLKAGGKGSAQRDSWLRAAEEFHEIYKLDPKWGGRPAALFRMAECLEELARRSDTRSDYQSAAAVYEELALRHAQSRLADDALLRAAVIKAEQTEERGQALRLLERIRTQYAQSDMAPKARDLERSLNARAVKEARRAPAEKPSKIEKSAKNSASEKAVAAKKDAELSRVVWKTLDGDQVRIEVELDRNVDWQARKLAGKGKKPSTLALDLDDAVPLKEIRTGARVTGSPLTAVRVDCAKGRTRLYFDFSALAAYETRVEEEPFRIILEVSAKKARKEAERPKAVAAEKTGRAAGETKGRAPALAAVAPQDLASQLGLHVETVFLDAGHGGKDPGTGHNGVLEREVALDVTRRVGRLLQHNGLEVRYSREKDMFVSLGERTRRANASGADLFVSIHVNAAPDAQVSGFETYYLDLAANTDAARLATQENAGSDKKMGSLNAVLTDFMLSARTQESRRLAQLLQNTALTRFERERQGTRDGGVKAAPLHVLIGTSMPAVLVELGYCTNAKEARKLADPGYRKVLADGIAEGILAYRAKLQRKNSVDLKTPPKNS